jgi:hypothetical protein
MKSITVAGVSLGLEGELDLLLSEKHALFTSEIQDPTIRLKLDYAPVPSMWSDVPAVFDSQGIWRVKHMGSQLLYEFSSPAFDVNPYKSVIINDQLTQGVLHFPSHGIAKNKRSVHPLDIPLEQLILSHHLAQKGGVELHCCAIALNGKAILLCGSSGAGKSTSANLWLQAFPEAQVLSDDRVILKIENETLVAHGTPWHGEAGFALNAALPVAGIFLLKQSPINMATKLSAMNLLKELYRLTFPPVWNADVISCVLDVLTKACPLVPAWTLEFRPDLDSVKTAMSVISTISS